jgi:cytochrome c biogenesis protein CcdA
MEKIAWFLFITLVIFNFIGIYLFFWVKQTGKKIDFTFDKKDGSFLNNFFAQLKNIFGFILLSLVFIGITSFFYHKKLIFAFLLSFIFLVSIVLKSKTKKKKKVKYSY